MYNILRAQRDIGGQSRLGMAYTDRVVGNDYNRVADVDGRILFGQVYSGSPARASRRRVAKPPRQAESVSSAGRRPHVGRPGPGGGIERQSVLAQVAPQPRGVFRTGQLFSL